MHADARRDRRVETMATLQHTADLNARPVQEYLAMLETGNPVHEGDAKYLSPTDPSAAWNTKEGKGRFGYFTNYLVDTDHAIIVEVEATPARISQEIRATKIMLDRIENKHGIKPAHLAADKAYGTGPFLAWLQDRNIVQHIPVLDRQRQSDGLFPRDAFTYDQQHDRYVCPQGKVLKHRTACASTRLHTYRAISSDCRTCPIQSRCTRGKQRTLSVPFDDAIRQQVIAQQHTDAFGRSQRFRKKVEMLFGHMKQQFRFTRLKLRGLADATEEFLLIATVQNLRRLLRLRPPDIPIPRPTAFI